MRILPLEAATSTLSVTTSRSYKDTSTGVHFMSPGLLQLAAVRSDRQTHAASTVGAACCGKADHKSVNFIGCRSDDELNSRLPAWYTRCCQAKYRPIWLTIFISPRKVLIAPSGPLREESALSLVFTDVLLQLDHVLEQLTCQFARQGSQLHRIQKTTGNIHVSDGLFYLLT